MAGVMRTSLLPRLAGADDGGGESSSASASLSPPQSSGDDSLARGRLCLFPFRLFFFFVLDVAPTAAAGGVFCPLFRPFPAAGAGDGAKSR